MQVDEEMVVRGCLKDEDELLFEFGLMDIVAQPWIRWEWPLIRRGVCCDCCWDGLLSPVVLLAAVVLL